MKNELKNIKKIINEFYTKGIAFRQLSRADAFPLFNACQHEEFNKYLAWNKSSNEEDVIMQIDMLLREEVMGESVPFSMIERETGKWMGLMKYAIYKDSIILTLWSHPDYWSGRSVIFGLMASISMVFENTEINKIYARHHYQYNKLEKLLKGINFQYIENEIVEKQTGDIMECKVHCLKKENHKKIVTLNEY